MCTTARPNNHSTHYTLAPVLLLPSIPPPATSTSNVPPIPAPTVIFFSCSSFTQYHQRRATCKRAIRIILLMLYCTLLCTKSRRRKQEWKGRGEKMLFKAPMCWMSMWLKHLSKFSVLPERLKKTWRRLIIECEGIWCWILCVQFWGKRGFESTRWPSQQKMLLFVVHEQTVGERIY